MRRKTPLQTLFLVLVLTLCSTVLVTASAAQGYFETAKDDVPVWSKASSKSTQLKRIAKKGTVVFVVSSTTNDAGNLWHRIADGSWIFSGNLKTHSHSYTGGICTKCQYEWPYQVTSLSGTYTVSNPDGASIWKRPYSKNTTKVRLDPYGKALTVVGQTTNQAGNLWYKLSDGNWVYSGNVKKAAGGHVHTASMCTIGVTSYAHKDATHHYKVSTFDELCSCGAVVTKNVSTRTAEKHSYGGGLCSVCKYEWPYQVTALNGTYTVINPDGATIWKRPYSGNSTKVRIAPPGSSLTVVGKTVNQPGNLWYKLSDGNWVFSGNVDQALVTYTIQYNANGGASAPGAQTHYANTCSDLSTKVPTRGGYVFQGWGVSKGDTSPDYQPGGSYDKNSNVTLYAIWKEEAVCKSHKYTSAGGDYCTLCGAKFQHSYTDQKVTGYAIRDGVPLRSAPYARAGNIVRELKEGDEIKIRYVFQNSLGNTWYKTEDSYYIFADNVTTNYTHRHAVAKTVPEKVTYEYLDLNSHMVYRTLAAKVCSCGHVMEGGQEVSNLQLHQKGQGSLSCVLCQGEMSVQEQAISPTLYATRAGNVPVYKNPKTQSTKVHTLSKTGTLVTIVATKSDLTTHWGKTVNGTWIEMSRLTQSDLSLPPAGVYVTNKASVPLRKEADSNAKTQRTLGRDVRVKVEKTYYNHSGNPWGTTSDGYEIFMGNLDYTGGEIAILLNGKELAMPSAPMNQKGTVLVPARAIAEGLGAYVTWDQEHQIATIQRGLDTIVFQIGNDRVFAKNIQRLNVSAQIIKGSTYVPLRALAEQFGATVTWVGDTQTVKIDCYVPSEKEIVDDFTRRQFAHFAGYYRTFAQEHDHLGTDFLRVLGNLGDYGELMFTSAMASTSPHLLPLYLDRFQSVMDQEKQQDIKANLDAILSTIPEISFAYSHMDRMVGQVEDAGKLAKMVKDGSDLAVDNPYLKQFLLTADLAAFSTEMMTYIIQDFQRNMYYLDVVEEACADASPNTKKAIDALRTEYTNKYAGIVDRTIEKIKAEGTDFLIGEALSAIPYARGVYFFTQASLEVFGVNSYTAHVQDASLGYLLATNLNAYHSDLFGDLATTAGKARSSTTQKEWDTLLASFVVNKAAVLSVYEHMQAVTDTPAISAYLQGQMDVLTSLQVQDTVSKAKSGAYYIQHN